MLLSIDTEYVVHIADNLQFFNDFFRFFTSVHGC